MSNLSSHFINSSNFTPCDSLPSFSSYSYSFFTSSFYKVSTSRTYPISLISTKITFLQYKSNFKTNPFQRISSNMTITEYRDEEDDENPPLLLESEMKEPRRIALFVEPSPFA